MKKAILLLVISLSLTSCVAQKPEPIPKINVLLTVNTIAGEAVTFQGDNSLLLIGNINDAAFRIPENLQLEEGRKYFVSFQYRDCHSCFKKQILILGYCIAPTQAQKDQATLAKQFN